MSAIYSIVMATALVCNAASTGERAPAEANLFPQVFEAEPAKRFIDLGPVLVSSESKDEKQALYLSARKLKADGFILEGRDFKKVYMINLDRNPEWRKRNPALAVVADVAAIGVMLAVSGRYPRSTYKVERVRYYRAIKFVDAVPDKVAVERLALAQSDRALFESARDLEEQLQMAHCLFLSDQIKNSDYQALRDELLKQL